MKRFLAFGLLTLLMWGCVGGAASPDDRPDPWPGHDDGSEKYDFTPELADAETRFTADWAAPIRYSGGGVLAVRESDVRRWRLRLIDMAGGREVALEGDCPLAEGPAAGIVLMIDGKRVDVDEVVVARADKKGAWIGILAPDGHRAVMVVTDVY